MQEISSHAEPQTLSAFLNTFFLKRKKKNSKYSMRAFARDLSMTQGRLWELMQGRYVPGKKVTDRLANTLGLSDHQRTKLAELVIQSKIGNRPTLRELKNDDFALVSDWEHFAIFNLLATKNCQSSPEWLANRLSIPPLVAEGAVDRLLKAGLLEPSDNGLRPKYSNIATEHEVPSAVLREAQRQVIMQSLTSLLRDPVEIRSVTSITLPVNLKNIPEAKKLISEFSTRLAELMEKGECTEVYNLAVQLVPVTLRKESN